MDAPRSQGCQGDQSSPVALLTSQHDHHQPLTVARRGLAASTAELTGPKASSRSTACCTCGWHSG